MLLLPQEPPTFHLSAGQSPRATEPGAALSPSTESCQQFKRSMLTRPRTWQSLNLDLVTLRIYAAAVEERSLAGAATREHMALSAVSRRIADLESRSGLVLLNRHDRGVTPTAAGELLFGWLGQAFDALERIASDLDALRDGTTGRIRIQAHISATMLLPPRLATFLEQFPKVQIEVEESGSADILRCVQAGKADLGFVVGIEVPSDLTCATWHEDQLVAVLPAQHPLCKAKRLSFIDLVPEPFIGLQKESTLQRLYDQNAAAQGCALDLRANATSFESVRCMVQAGFGVSVLPRLAMEPYVRSGSIACRPLTDSWAKRPLLLCYKSLDALDAPARRMVSHILEPKVSATTEFVGREAGLLAA